ncbi:MAG: hypothetical protein WBF17_17690 [Phycisphaerae bacterium]
MKRWDRAILAMAVVCVIASALAAAPAADAAAAAKEQAAQRYEQIANAFLNSKWAELAEALPVPASQLRYMTPQQRDDVAYVRKTITECRPRWWKAAKGTTEAKFRVTLWGRSMSVAYTPGEKSNVNVQTIGGQQVIGVSWNPSPIDSEEPAVKSMAAHGCTAGDLADLTVWRTLANAQLMVSMPIQALAALQKRDKEGFNRYFLFRANVAVLYHCSPRARHAALIACLAAFMDKYGSGPIAGSNRAVGAMLVAEVLAAPAKWPSLPLPQDVPADDAEKAVAVHLKMQVGKAWTIAEDKALREATLAFSGKNNKQVAQYGKVVLPNKLVFMLEAAKDAPFKAKRNAWVAQQLQKAAKAGK